MKKKDRELMTKEELVEDFNKEFSRNNRWLQDLADKNKRLVKKHILGKPKNSLYTPNDTRPIRTFDKEYFALIKWTIPLYNYEYKWISTEQIYKEDYLRASIIPVVKIEGLNYWLLGSFHDYDDTENPILGDFGGSCDEEDRKKAWIAIVCAMRELGEESKGVLTDIVRASLNEGNFAISRGTRFNDKERKEDRVCFLFVELNYEDIKNINSDFQNKYSEKRVFGSLRFCSQKDVKEGKFRTSRNLTDLLQFMSKHNL